jgi:hypothetical protein
MANNIDVNYVQKYNDNLQLLAQQKNSRFRHAVTVGSHFGKQASPVDHLNPTNVQQRTSRFQPKVLTDIAHDRRWVQPISYSTHTPVDDFDTLRMRTEPGSQYLNSQIAAMNRKYDDIIIDSFFTSALDVAAGSADLTVAKLKEGRQILLENEVDMDDPEQAIYCAISPHQENSLLTQNEIVNADYGNTIFDKNNGLHGRTWFGITFILTNRLQDSNGTIGGADSATRWVPMWAKSGMHLGLWDDLRGVIKERTDLTDDPMEMSVYSTFGATRLEESKVVRIVCDETA